MKPLPPSTYAPTGRVHAPALDQMEPTARAMYDHSLTLFGGPGGPRMPLLHLPALAEAWGGVNRAIMASPLPVRYRELAIILVSAFWKAEMEWLMHAGKAEEAGIAPGAVEAIRLGLPPVFSEHEDLIVYNYVMQLQRDHAVDDEAYDATRTLLADAGLVALTVTVGHFTSVAMTLKAHRLPIPEECLKAFAD